MNRLFDMVETIGVILIAGVVLLIMAVLFIFLMPLFVVLAICGLIVALLLGAGKITLTTTDIPSKKDETVK